MPASVYDEPSAQHEQQRAQRLRKTARWILGVGTAVMMALGLVLLFLLTVAAFFVGSHTCARQVRRLYPRATSITISTRSLPASAATPMHARCGGLSRSTHSSQARSISGFLLMSVM